MIELIFNFCVRIDRSNCWRAVCDRVGVSILVYGSTGWVFVLCKVGVVKLGHIFFYYYKCVRIGEGFVSLFLSGHSGGHLVRIVSIL